MEPFKENVNIYKNIVSIFIIDYEHQDRVPIDFKGTLEVIFCKVVLKL
jgi:hypothetical protein